MTWTNHYSWPDYPRRASSSTWENEINNNYGNYKEYWYFAKKWTAAPWEPYLFVMTQEDAGGIIYSSAYFLMIIQNEGLYTSSDTAALTTMLTGYKREVCDQFYADKGAFTTSIVTTPSSSFFRPDNPGSNAVYVFDRFHQAEVDCGPYALPMCMDDLDSAYNAYTLQRMEPGPADTSVLGTDFDGGAFKFDPATRTLTISETTPHGDGAHTTAKFTLCLGTNCGDWYMSYQFYTTVDCTTYSLALDTTGIIQTYSASFPYFELNLNFPNAFSYPTPAWASCPLTYYQVTVTDPNGLAYVMEMSDVAGDDTWTKSTISSATGNFGSQIGYFEP